MLTHSYSIRASLLEGDVEPTAGNALPDVYANFGNIEYAFVQSLSEKRNLITFNSIISGYVIC